MKFRALGLIALVILVLALALPATAQEACTTRTTVGTYMYTCDGLISPAPGAPLLPAKGLGMVTSDRNGTFMGGATFNIGGAVIQQQLTGTENLNPDCTGTITYKQTINGTPVPNDLHITFIVSDKGDTIDGLITDTNAVLSCKLKRTTKATTAN
jgi:hypothetical protein